MTKVLLQSQELVRSKICCSHINIYMNLKCMENIIVKESMLPIAVYEAVWIHCISAVVHMTLIEQVAARSMKAYWIRIGAATYRRDQSMGNAADGVDSVDSVAAGESFQVLATLSNEVGRLIIDQPDDWVDLPAVRHFDIFRHHHMNQNTSQ